MAPVPRSPSLVFEPLAKHHDRAAFSCGNETLDRYLKERASQDARRRIAAPFVVVSKTDPQIILGYYTLSSFGIVLGDLPANIVKKLPDYPIVPATLLGRLAVDQSHHGQGLGGDLLIDALGRAFAQSSQIASYAVVVDAIDQNAISFYKNYDFLPFPDNPNRLFLPMKTIGDLFRKT
jgi:GNAT superfamily N-acetyltransferase